MARKKSLLSKISPEHKTAFFALIFMLAGILTFVAEPNTDPSQAAYLDLQTRFANTLLQLFGENYKFLFGPVAIVLSVFLFKEKGLHFNGYRAFWLMFFLISATTLLGGYTLRSDQSNYQAVFNLYPTLVTQLWAEAVVLVFVLLLFASLYILFRFSVLHATIKASKMAPSLSELKDSFVAERQASSLRKESRSLKSQSKRIEKEAKQMDKESRDLEKQLEELKREKEQLAKMKQPKQIKKATDKKVSVSKTGGIGSLFSKEKKSSGWSGEVPVRIFGNWKLPDINHLDNKWGEIIVDENEIRRKEIEIEEKLLQFGIQVSMQWYKVGPTVIQYRLKPKEWVKLQKIVNLKKDLTLALHAKNIRIQAPIPGLGAVGIEVPNDDRQMVGLKEVLESPGFTGRKNDIPIAIGKDVSGNIMVGDLTKMPHLLVAGQTASGKSVGMNGFLISMLYKFSPTELKMIMVDPKRVELSVYNGIPHLLTPVITNPEKALNALKWAVAEMLRRYDLATQVNARNLKEYNSKVSKQEKLPYIVIVIDELADLMMSGQKKEVEGSIARIAQMARAVGMHLIVATQRPSVDVITGLIKANIPSRIAFTVASQIDSRTVIDKMGAEDLLGRGDMLYYPTGAMEPERIQGVFVETHEIESVVNEIKMTIDPDMLKNMQDSEIADGKSSTAGSIMEWYEWEQDEDPEIIEKAIQVVKESKKGSTSLIQRKLSLGYARAAKVLDILEELGVVWPANGSKPRDVYVD